MRGKCGLEPLENRTREEWRASAVFWSNTCGEHVSKIRKLESQLEKAHAVNKELTEGLEGVSNHPHCKCVDSINLCFICTARECLEKHKEYLEAINGQEEN